MPDYNDAVLALDIGRVRIGMALANMEARMPRPLGVLQNDASVFDQLRLICNREHVGHLVFGLPTGIEGQHTQQTDEARKFGEQCAQEVGLPYSWQDEAVTSVNAEAELQARGKPYTKQDIDALAAVYILEDYLHV